MKKTITMLLGGALLLAVTATGAQAGGTGPIRKPPVPIVQQLLHLLGGGGPIRG